MNNRKNLAPNHCRQRVVIELLVNDYVWKEFLEQYLLWLSQEVAMTPVDWPYIYPCWELWFWWRIHWTTSWAHIYSYPPENNWTDKYLVTIDAYTCKPFSLDDAVNYTKKYFETDDIVWKEI